MGFFTHEAIRNAGGTKYLNEQFESLLEDSSIEPSAEDLTEAGIDAVITMNENYNKIMKRTAIAESSALEETGEEFVYTEGVLGSLYETIKSFLNKIWEKIKALFKRFMMTIDSYAKNDKEFCNKYRKDILSKSIDSDFTFKGYKWNLSGIEKLFGQCSTESHMSFDATTGDLLTDTSATGKANRGQDFTDKDAYEKQSDKQSDEIEKINGIILNEFTQKHKGQSLTNEEFRKELHEALRSGDTEKQELDSNDTDADPNHCFTELYTSNETKKAAKRAFDDSRKVIDRDLKTLDRLDKERIKDAGKYEDEYYGEGDVDTGSDAVKAAATTAGAAATDTATTTALKAWINAGGKAVKTTKAEKNSKNDMSGRRLHWYTKVSNATKTCLTTANSEFLNALKERSRQYKALLIAVVHYKSNNESVQESYNYAKSNFRSTGIFSGIDFK